MRHILTKYKLTLGEKKNMIFELILLPECRTGYSAKWKYEAPLKELLRVPRQWQQNIQPSTGAFKAQRPMWLHRAHVHEASSAWVSPGQKSRKEKCFRGVWFLAVRSNWCCIFYILCVLWKSISFLSSFSFLPFPSFLVFRWLLMQVPEFSVRTSSH